MSAHSAESVLILPGVYASPCHPHSSLLQYEAIMGKKRDNTGILFPALIAD